MHIIHEVVVQPAIATGVERDKDNKGETNLTRVRK